MVQLRFGWNVEPPFSIVLIISRCQGKYNIMLIRYLPKLLLLSILFTSFAMAAERGPAVPDYPADRIADGVYVIHGPLGVPSVQNQGFMNNPGFIIGHEGVIVGIHSRENDLVVNPLKGKQLTNVRASGKDDSIILTPPLQYSLEQALEFIEDDELVEVTPSDIRLRKKHLKEFERKRASRE